MSIDNDLSRLSTLGWKPLYRQHVTPDELTRYAIGRVTVVERDLFRVQTAHSEQTARLPGRWHHHATDGNDYPTVGDWVLLDSIPQGAPALIHRLLPRVSLLQRTAVGQEDSAGAAAQLLCANIDTVLIVAALDQTFNPRSIERYLTLVRGGGVQAVIVLTKADRHTAPQRQAEALKQRLRLPAVVTINNMADDARSVLAPWWLAGDTLALLGALPATAGRTAYPSKTQRGGSRTAGAAQSVWQDGENRTARQTPAAG